MRKAFGLWQAIMIILIISGLMLVVLKYSKIAAKHTSDTYVREQTQMYLDSVIEMTLLNISLHSKDTCLSSYTAPLKSTNGIEYSADVNITKYYLKDTDEFGSCSSQIVQIEAEESHGMVMLEVEARAKVNGSLTTRILRRTLQRP